LEAKPKHINITPGGKEWFTALTHENCSIFLFFYLSGYLLFSRKSGPPWLSISTTAATRSFATRP
jgi:hypothetical protein